MGEVRECEVGGVGTWGSERSVEWGRQGSGRSAEWGTCGRGRSALEWGMRGNGRHTPAAKQIEKSRHT